jgi:hypothetical protein
VSTKPLEDTLNAVAAIADVTQPRSPSAATATSAAASAAVNAADGTTAANLQLADNALQLSLSAAHPLDVSAALAELSLKESQSAATAAAAAAAATLAAAKAEAAAARTVITSDAEPASDDDAAAAAAAAAAAEQAQTAAALAADWAQYVEALAERHKPRRAALQKALLSHCGADLQALAHTLALQQQQQPASDNSSSSSDSSSEQDAAAVAVAAAEAAAAAQQRVLAWAVEKRGGWRGAVLLDTGDVDVEADVTIWPQRDQASFVCCTTLYSNLLCCERQCRSLSTVHEHYNICLAGIACIEQYCSVAVLQFAVVGITLQRWTVSLHANTNEHTHTVFL